METASLADAKNRLSELIIAVQGTWERVLITKNGRPAAVLIAPEDLESLIETIERGTRCGCRVLPGVPCQKRCPSGSRP